MPSSSARRPSGRRWVQAQMVTKGFK
jgi:hypothetical protein